VVPEAKLEEGVPQAQGWFVVNAREARWLYNEMGWYIGFEGKGEAAFDQLGINLNVLHPGMPMAMYHEEPGQEAFLVLRGECLLIVEGEERPLKAWDFVHCPAWTEHVLVGAGSGPCVVVAVGARREDDEVLYPVSELAQRYGGSVLEETSSAEEAYARFSKRVDRSYRDGDLPDW
jgi:uncharacterized cupin superfamily protein